MLKARALLIGLNYSNVAKETALTGCINDVKNMKEFLQELMVDQDFNITVITDEDPNMMDRVSWSGLYVNLLDLCIKSWSEDLDVAIFHYSGHGRQTASLSSGGYINSNANTENDGLDEGIVPVDYAKYGIIRDDVLNAIFTRFNPKTRILCIFDCCHSGSILDLHYQWGLKGLWSDVHNENENHEIPWIICLSAGRDIDVAGEVHKKIETGAFTTYLLDYFNKKGSDAHIIKMQKTINDNLGDAGYDQIHTVSSSRNIHVEDSIKSFLLYK